MDPRQILAAGPHGAAEPQLKYRQHLRQNTAFGCQHHAGAQQAHAGVIALRATGDLLPAGAQLMGKLVVRRLLFGYHHFP
ncbi:hypothetical protein D3C79_1028570 [compost metagenome]